MTTEEKAKAYDELFAHVKEFHARFSNQCSIKTEMEECIPELVESEDERIRKVIYELVEAQPTNEFCGEISKDDCLAYLEKQKEQKTDVNDICVRKMVEQYRCTDEYDEGGNLKGKPVNCMVRAYEQGIRDILKIVKQKPLEWSDEDEKELQGIICDSEQKVKLDCNQIRFLKHLYEQLKQLRDENFKEKK